MPTGRERRRTDLYGRVRRFLYGLLLLAAAPGAMAADEMASLGRYRAQPVVAAAEKLVTATLQGLVLLHASDEQNPLQGNGYPHLGLDTVTARIQDNAIADAPLFRVAVSDGGEVRDGMGFDLALPDIGNFHLNLYARSNAKTAGKRWNMSGDEASPRSWSVGGTLELVRSVDGSRHLAFVPELLLDIDNSGKRYLPFQAAVKVANWRSLAERRSLDEEVPQIAFKWRL